MQDAVLAEMAANINSRQGYEPRHAGRWTRQTVGAVVAGTNVRAA